SRRAPDVGCSPDALSEFCNRCAQTVGLGEDDEFGCASCRGRRLVWSRAVRLGAYSGDLAEWVREVKFQRNASLGVDMGRALAERLAAAGLPDERVCVVPVPMSARDRLFRGVDHARCVAEGVAKGLRAPLVRALLRRHGPSQREMPSATARERNVRRAFTLRRGVDLSGWTAVLVDDVITTGATMRAASRTLWPRRLDSRPASIWAAAVGVTPDPSRLAESPGRAASDRDA
ncbi:MAG: ComF family protein, partial [Phycisphaerales bacterium]